MFTIATSGYELSGNIFGNLDGKVLDDPVNKAGKAASKTICPRDSRPRRRPWSRSSTSRAKRLETAWDTSISRVPGHADDAPVHLAGCDFLAPPGSRPGRFTDLAQPRPGRADDLLASFKAPRASLNRASCASSRCSNNGPRKPELPRSRDRRKPLFSPARQSGKRCLRRSLPVGWPAPRSPYSSAAFSRQPGVTCGVCPGGSGAVSLPYRSGRLALR